MPHNSPKPNNPTRRAPAASAAVDASRSSNILRSQAATPHAYEPTVGGNYWERAASQLTQRTVYQPLASFLLSFVLHTLVLILLGLWLYAEPQLTKKLSLVVSAPEFDEEGDLSNLLVEDSSLNISIPATIQDPISQPLMFPDAPNVPSPIAGPLSELPAEVVQRDWQTNPAMLVESAASLAGGGIEGRSQEARGNLLAKYGGTRQSEDAVTLALEWLVAHQRPDGSWRFNHQDAPCNGRCANPGSVETTTGATALALLPFLGRNHTPKEGEYQEVVQRGLYYLTGRMRDSRMGGDFQEGTMYAQGLSAICLCEAYAMTRDPELREYAQKSIDFICSVQHPRGGWRYYPGQPGDTTSFGWQLMALKSARMGGLQVPSPVIERAKSYLDRVQSTNGAFYGYLEKGREPGSTAIGLLCRMYTGWRREDDRLRQGVEYLAELGPSPHDMYFNYYATQTLRHYEGPLWEKWNQQLRDYLVESQARNDHAQGSWFFPDQHGTIGGRLYTTAICAMILEVYYRHMPIYSSASIEDEF